MQPQLIAMTAVTIGGCGLLRTEETLPTGIQLSGTESRSVCSRARTIYAVSPGLWIDRANCVEEKETT
jgi:hypothetical protein